MTAKLGEDLEKKILETIPLGSLDVFMNEQFSAYRPSFCSNFSNWEATKILNYLLRQKAEIRQAFCGQNQKLLYEASAPGAFHEKAIDAFFSSYNRIPLL